MSVEFRILIIRSFTYVFLLVLLIWLLFVPLDGADNSAWQTLICAGKQHCWRKGMVSKDNQRNNNVCYTSKLKYVFRLDENVSRVMGQNSLTPQGEQNAVLRRQTTTWTLDSHVISSCPLKPREIWEPAGVKQTISSQFVLLTFESGGITKHWIDWPAQPHCFLNTWRNV